VRPVAQCGPRCRVRRDSALFYVFYDGIAAQCGPFGVELASALHLVFDDGLHDFTVFTTTYGLHDFPSPLFIPIVATLQRLEGVAVGVLTSRTWFCRSSLRAV
jgi:hypothetical protein